jgi:branched-chain amino acid transport system ATP-binding protein
MSVDAVLELVGVRAGYGPIEVLHGIDLCLPGGSVVALLGPNGGGKSTTLKVCAGLLPLRAGELRLGGRVVNGATADQLARAGLCTIPEGRGIFPNLTVRENLWLATTTGATLDAAEAAAYDRFPLLGHRRAQLAGTLSGGEQQMLALSRALGTDPAVLLLDELSLGLAPKAVEAVYASVRLLIEGGATILLVEQDLSRAMEVASRIVCLLEGSVVLEGPASELSREQITAAYFGLHRGAGRESA